jgi:hypothetical protein
MRVSCFYQVAPAAIAFYTDPLDGLPDAPEYMHVFSHSHATAAADGALADAIHAGGPSFKYAPCFDLNDHPGWYGASDAQLAAWARRFRDAALRARADLFGFNELFSRAGADPRMRNQAMTLLRYLNEPDGEGRRLDGVFFLTEAAATPRTWTSRASDFWRRVDETCVLVVGEHYHGHEFVCGRGERDLADHLFAMRRWLDGSGEAAKQRIANEKYTVLHSSRFGPGPSVWQGGDASRISLARFQRNLSRLARVTRRTPGGRNRIAFGPLAAAYTAPGVHPRIRLLFNWHYGQGGHRRELRCVDAYEGNCRC